MDISKAYEPHDCPKCGCSCHCLGGNRFYKGTCDHCEYSAQYLGPSEGQNVTRTEPYGPLSYHLQDFPRFIRLELLNNGPFEHAVPLAYVNRLPAWQAAAIGPLFEIQAERHGLHVEKIGTDMYRDALIARLSRLL